MARLYAEEGFDYGVVEVLRSLGHDVLTVQEAGRQGQPDLAVIAFAKEEGRAILTFNRKHFVAIHKKGTAHCGILACTRDPDQKVLGQRIHNEVVTSGGVIADELFHVCRPQR